jgi:peptidyl-prolyl cis-trans isomerase SurA
MKKVLFLIAFPFFLNAQNPAEPVKKDSIKTKNTPQAGRSKDEARQLLESYRQRILNGENFSVLAALYSEDPGSAKQGGQLPPFGRGVMVQEFEEVAFNLKPGQISDIFETQFGFHFIQLLAREGEKVMARHILISAK